MKKLALIATAVMTMMAVGCQETLQESLEMTSSEKSVAVEGETSPLSFTASSAWTIASDADWVTFDRTEGEAGDVTVEMTVTANDGYESRTAKVTITMGAKSNVITITQAGRAEFAIETVYNISAEAQTIDFAIESNIEYTYEISEDAQDWIEAAVDSKAAPVESTLKFDVKENNTVVSREGRVYIEADNAIYCLVVTQSGGEEDLATATATYLGNTQKIYSDGFTSFREYFIEMTSEDGNTVVTIALNAPEVADQLAEIPAGEYIIDAANNHADNTFTIKPLDGSEDYYTSIIIGGQEMEVIEGNVTVSNDNGTYTIKASFVDAASTPYQYSYVGAIESIADKSLGGQIGGYWRSTYFTYYSTKANRWDLTLYVNKLISSDVPSIQMLNLYLYGESGDITGDVIPEGTYTCVEETTIESDYANGIVDAQPFTFSTGTSYSDGEDRIQIKPGSTITVSRNENGSYNLDIDFSLRHYTDDYVTETEVGTIEYETTLENVKANINLDYYQGPNPDVPEVELTSVFMNQYTGCYIGNKWGIDNTNAFFISLTNCNGVYTFDLTLNIEGSWVYETNFANRFCNTPLPESTCTFSDTPAANTVLPVVYSTNGSTASYRATVRNSYSGTTALISGGSITISSSEITFNLQATKLNSDEVYTFTGTAPCALYYLQNHSTGNYPNYYYTFTEWNNRNN